MLNVLLVPIGSAGDVHPFLGLACELRERGHRVTIITSPHFESLVARFGFELVPLGTKEEFDQVASDPNLWKGSKGFQVIARWGMLRTLPIIYEAIDQRLEPGRTVVASQVTGLGARCAQEKLGVPLATIHLQPAALWSVHDTPKLGPLLVGPCVPKFVKRFQYWLANKIVDRMVLAELNDFRRGLGLPPVRSLMPWWNSPQRIVCLFPKWFAARQPDWPPQTVVTDFPLWDDGAADEMPAEVEAFLSAGEPPIAFTPGSANVHGAGFFSAAVDACQRLGRRGLLLTRHAEQIPGSLPPDVAHFDYVPFGRLLPRTAALVHHGGIGSLAQALAAGIPQLIMPLAHDQPDNARRIEKLGVGGSVLPRHFRGPKVAAALAPLLSCPRVAENCRHCAGRFQGPSAKSLAADEIENLMKNSV